MTHPQLLLGALILSCLATPALAGPEGEPTPSGTGAAPTAVVGGRVAALDERFGTVAIVDPDTGDTVCSGVLIGPDVVLTAAHCLVEASAHGSAAVFRGRGPDVYAGALDVRAALAEQVFKPLDWRVHPGFRPGAAGADAANLSDIGVIVLESMTPEALVVAHERPGEELGTEGAQLLLSGFGRADGEDPKSSGVLHVGEVSIWLVDEGEIEHTSPSGVDSCGGDSGGPLYAQTADGVVVVAVSSRGVGPAGSPCGAGGIATRVAPYAEWIEDAVAEIREAASPSGSPTSGGCGAGSSPESGWLVAVVLWLLVHWRRPVFVGRERS